MKKVFGNLFTAITGVEFSQEMDIETINQSVESKGKNKLHIERYSSNVVPNRGNIFRYTRKYKDVDQRIDHYLSM